MNPLKTVEEVAVDLWAKQHSGLVKDNVKFPNNFNGIGAAYGGYARIIDTLTQDRQATLAALVTALERKKHTTMAGIGLDFDEYIHNQPLDQAITIVKELLTPTT